MTETDIETAATMTTVEELQLKSYISVLCEQATMSVDHSRMVKKAFCMGVWYRKFPWYAVQDLGDVWGYQLVDMFGEAAAKFTGSRYETLFTGFTYRFISDTGTSWHQCYKDFRNLGWQRKAVKRDGGRLSYLMTIHNDSAPEGFKDLWLLLDINIATCKVVQTGTKMVEVPIMETFCEDIEELVEEEESEVKVESEAKPFDPDVFIQQDVDETFKDPKSYTPGLTGSHPIPHTVQTEGDKSTFSAILDVSSPDPSLTPDTDTGVDPDNIPF